MGIYPFYKKHGDGYEYQARIEHIGDRLAVGVIFQLQIDRFRKRFRYRHLY